MRQTFRKLTICIALTALAAFGQTKPAFEVATVRPSAPLDPAKMMAAMQAGGKMPIGINVDAKRAEYTFMDLKSLIANAYGVKAYQITGPDWLANTRFDIVAKLPDGATKEDAPKMLQSLLEERFKLTTHRTSAEHPVLALVVGKGGPKMKESAEKPVAIDESAPLKPGEVTMNQGDGPMRMRVDTAAGGAVIDMGLKGKMTSKMNAPTMSIHMDFSMITMDGFADMLTQMFSQFSRGAATRQVVNMTDVKGNYEASLEIALSDLMNMAGAQGMNMGGGPGGPGTAAPVASDPGGGGASSLADAVQSMGLKLVNSKAMVDQFIVDHVEKTPTDN
jgi:uncharacterized protein (TIGR03435 family)